MLPKFKSLLIPMLGIVLVWFLVLPGCGPKPSAGGKPPQQTPEVGVVVITPGPVTLTRELSGRTSPFLIAEVRPQVGGIIQERLFTEGSDVKVGQILYQIVPASYQAAYASAKAALARAKAAHAGAEAAHASVKAALARAESNAVPLRLKAGRFKELAPINAVSTQDADDATAAMQQAEAGIEGAGAAVKGAEAGIKSAEAEIEAAEAALETARINLAYTQVVAPISGRIGKSTVTTGALVTASQAAPLATIQDFDSVYVDVTQSSAEMLRLNRIDLASGGMGGKNAAGQARVKLVLEDGTAYPIPGILKFSDVTVDPSTGSVTLRTVFSNPQHLLLPGMFVRTILEEGVREQAILVPQRGVSRNPAGNAMVMVVGSEEKVEPRVIKVERTIGENWLVSEGLKAGDRIILEGIQRARPGTPVKVVPFGSKPEAAPPAGPPQSATAKK
ncbi:MAG: efflux transporter periplasmic adaptor subunit [Deltaproteobacteria bacterium RIFOXYD12_FULL_50_9]|nr:MAG: efflux transporter periplasmic adaptor subunit [Deltaproteobacteria bacterium RIFOXYD12_FULL_50_9]